MTVSIHAPARGATASALCKPGRLPVSIHAPARGATRIRRIKAPLSVTFQSTRPRGARPWRRTNTCHRLRFNPRARAGRDGARCRGLASK